MSETNRLLQMLPEDDRAALAQYLRPMKLDADDVLAEPGNKKSVNKIIVQVPGLASVIDRSPLRDLAERRSAIRSVLAAHDQFVIADIQQTAACNASHSTEARTARWILRMRNLVGDDLSLTQDYLAEMLGVRRSSVSEIAARLQAAGTIHYVRGRVHVTDPVNLERASCECHRAVERNYKSLLGVPWP